MSTTSVGQIGLDLVVNQKQFNKQMSGIMSLGKKVGTALAVTFSVTKIAQFGKACLNLGSDLQEVQNVVDVTFPNMKAKIDDFSKNAAASFGLSETMAKKYSSTLGSMAKSFGFTETQAYDMGTTLAGLAGDVASFYNLTQDEAYTKLKSVFTGETESLKDLGVVMTQSALDAYALANGFGKTTNAMSEAEKVALRYQFVQSKLSAAQGDFARTSDSWANQTKILSLQFESLKATIGQGLISAFTPVIKMVNTLLQKVQGLATSFKELMEGMFGAQSSSSDAFSNAADAAESAAESTGATANNLKKAKSFLAGFDAITKLSDDSTESSGTGSASVSSGGGNSTESSKQEETSGLSKNIEKLTKKFNNFSKSVKKLADQIKKGLAWGYENVLKPLAKWTLNKAVPAVLDLFSGAFDVLNSTIEALKPLGEWVWESFLEPIAKWTGGVIVTVLEKLASALKGISNWIDENQSTVESFVIVVGSFAIAWGLVNGALTAWNIAVTLWNSIGAIATVVTTAFSTAVAFLTSPITLVTVGIGALIAAVILLYRNWDTVKVKAVEVWNSIKEAVTTAVEGIKEKFKPIVEWFKERYKDIKSVFANVKIWFSEKFTAAYNAVKKPFTAVGEFFSNTYKTITEKFSNVKTWFSEKFKAAYNAVKKPFESIGEFFGGIYEKIKGIFKTIGTVAGDAIGGTFKDVINTILETIENTINKAIKFINKAINVMNKIPGVSISKVSSVELPRLAQGGFVKKNTPQLAVIGDNRHQGEVVAPEDKLTEMAMNAVRAASGNNYSIEILKVLKEILEVLKALDLDIVIDGKRLKDIIVEKINQHTIQTGVCEIIV